MSNIKFLRVVKRHRFPRNNVLILLCVVVVLNMSLLLLNLAVFDSTCKSSGDKGTTNFPYDDTLSKRQGKRVSILNWLLKPFPRPHFNHKSSKVLDEEEIEYISAEISKRNSQQLILNLDKFGEVNETTPVLLIQVHTRLENLKILINSLSYVREIKNSFLIFSHDMFSPEINLVIERINFTRVLQIFYPHSIQLHPHRFPGQGINDCPKTMPAQRAKEIQCENWKHPDIFGNYREAFYTQAKHHWWWKANFVFNHVTVLKNHTGLVALLEEDQYASPDLLWTLNLMEISMRENRCNGCSLFELGQRRVNIFAIRWYDPPFYSKTSFTNVHTAYIMVFNRTFWESAEKCTPEFCSYDDYNYDYSVKSIFRSCFSKPVLTLQTNFPRVFHTGLCKGMHKKAAPRGCNITAYAMKIRRTMEVLTNSKHKLLFPESLGICDDSKAKIPVPKRNGGWGDVRDKKLCISFSKMFAD